MQEVSEATIRELARQIDLPIENEELEELRTEVRAKLDAVESVAELAKSPTVPTYDEREWDWADSSENEYNEIIVNCSVPALNEDGILESYEVGVKDNVEVGGVPMTWGTSVVDEFVPKEDAPAVNRLLENGATVVAKTNLDAFGNAGLGTNGYRGAITNPYDAERTAGGSSGGSAVATATGTVDLAIGTDTGGSVRIPAAYCGVVGMKPSHGSIPLTGVVENTYVQDHVGVFATGVRDVARALEAMAGTHSDDPASLQAAGEPGYASEGYLDAVTDPPELDDVAVGVIDESLADCRNRRVAARTRNAVELLREAGARTERVTVPNYRYGDAVKGGLSYPANAACWRDRFIPFRRGGSANFDVPVELAERLSANEGINIDLKAKILAGAHVNIRQNGRPFVDAQSAREQLRTEFRAALSDVDVLLTPTMPDVAPRVEECPPQYDYGQNVRHANVVGIPAITLPNGTVDGLPIGLQLMAGRFNDDTLLGVAERVHAHLNATREMSER